MRRDELFDSAGSEDGGSGDEVMDSELRAQLNAQIARSLGLDSAEAPGSGSSQNKSKSSAKEVAKKTKMEDDGTDEEADGKEDSGDEFEFQLFSNSEPTTKVVLEDESLGDGAVLRRRPESYYLATRISEEQRRMFAEAATSADQILERAKCRSWGLELPWKVTHTTSSTRSKDVDDGQEEKKSRGRPGKKKRIAMRTKARSAAEKAKSESEKMAEKEEYMKEKKKKMNRIKKLKRKAREKEKKAGAAGGTEAGDSDDSE